MRSLGPVAAGAGGSCSTGLTRHRARRGISLVELLVALVLFGVVGGAVLRGLNRQARLHDALLADLDTRVQHAATHETMAVMLRSVSPGAGDIERLADSAIAYRLTIGGGVVCRLAPGRVVLAPDTVSGGQRLAGVSEWPQPDDSLWLLDEGPTDATIDDAWRAVRVTAVGRSTAACVGTSLLGPSDAARLSWTLDVSGSLLGAGGVGEGAPVRITRRARFALYRSGTESWLGFSEWNPGSGGWNVIQPVSGPYRPYDGALPSGSGLALSPHDSLGALAWAAPRFPAAVVLVTRTRSHPVSLGGNTRAPVDDSLRTMIGLRNAR